MINIYIYNILLLDYSQQYAVRTRMSLNTVGEFYIFMQLYMFVSLQKSNNV